MRRTSNSSGVADSAKSKARTSSTPSAQLERDPAYRRVEGLPTWVSVNNDALLGRHVRESAAGCHLDSLVFYTSKITNDAQESLMVAAPLNI